MSRGYTTSDTPAIRAAVLAALSESPIDIRAIHARVEAATGLEVGERRLYRAVRWAISSGRARKIRPESWRDQGGYVRVMGRAA